MEELVNLLNKAFADTFKLYLKAHNYHWNVEGIEFSQYHDFFGKLYEEVHCSIDTTAEHIRVLDAYVPGTMPRISDLSTVNDNAVTDLKSMLADLYSANLTVINSLMLVNTMAERFNEVGLANYVQGRIEVHKKHGWMLKASMKETNG